MEYKPSDILDKYTLSQEQSEEFLQENSNVADGEALNESGYQLIIDFYQNRNRDTIKLKGSTVSRDLSVSTYPNVIFSTEDKRIRFEQEDVITFLKKQPSNSVDLIVTDPAYSGMNQMLKLGKGKIIGKYSDKGDGAKWFDEFHDTEENYKSFLSECFRILKPNRHIYIMFDSFSLLTLSPLVRQIFDVKNILVWDKLNIGLGHYFRRRHEFILFASKGKRPLNSKNIPDIWRVKRITQAKYPTQKPTELFELMLAGSAEKDFVICDPFLGSGSSAIASLKRGCKFIGCDIAATSIEIARKRIETFITWNFDNLQDKSMCENDDEMQKIIKSNNEFV